MYAYKCMHLSIYVYMYLADIHGHMSVYQYINRNKYFTMDASHSVWNNLNSLILS